MPSNISDRAESACLAWQAIETFERQKGLLQTNTLGMDPSQNSLSKCKSIQIEFIKRMKTAFEPVIEHYQVYGSANQHLQKLKNLDQSMDILNLEISALEDENQPGSDELTSSTIAALDAKVAKFNISSSLVINKKTTSELELLIMKEII